MRQASLRPQSLKLSGFEPFRSGVLFEGDCIKALLELKRCHVGVDLVVTSPPYDDLRTYDGFNFDFFGTARLLADVLVVGGVVVWIVGDQITDSGGESCSSFRQALCFVEECGLRLHDTMIWVKSGFQYPERVRYHQQFEYMFVLSKGKPKTFHAITDRPNKSRVVSRGRQRNVGKRKRDGVIKYTSYATGVVGTRTNVWEIHGGEPMQKSRGGHPAIFPYALAADHVRSWSNPGDIVFDPFLGSGTTAHAADLLDRFWVGAECSGNYCTAVRKRISRVQNRFGGHEVTDALIDKRRLLGLSTTPQK